MLRLVRCLLLSCVLALLAAGANGCAGCEDKPAPPVDNSGNPPAPKKFPGARRVNNKLPPTFQLFWEAGALPARPPSGSDDAGP